MSQPPTTLSTTTAITPFEDILDELESLTRDHLLFFRVQVGGVFLRHFWNDDPAQFSSKNRLKSSRFELFYTKYQDTLKRYGLSRSQATNSIRAAIVVRSLPIELAERLFLSQVMALTRLHDPTKRALVAQAALTMDWNLDRLHDAVDAVRAGLPLSVVDAEVEQADATEPETDTHHGGPVPSPGRLVTRAEKLVSDVSAWSGYWQQVDPSRLRRIQRIRLAKAADELEVEVARLRKIVGDA